MSHLISKAIGPHVGDEKNAPRRGASTQRPLNLEGRSLVFGEDFTYNDVGKSFIRYSFKGCKYSCSCHTANGRRREARKIESEHRT
jgi:hypothetical protein